MKPFIVSRRSLLASSLGILAVPSLLRAGKSAARKEVAWLDEVQQAPRSLPADAPRLSPLAGTGSDGPVTTLEAWKCKRESIGQWWLDFLKPWQIDRGKPPALTVVEEDRPQGVVRQLVRYEVEPGLATEAYLLRPAAREGKRPGVVVLHPTVNQSIREPAGIEGRSPMAFGLNLAQRGCVAFCPRNFLWPTNRKIDVKPELARFRERHPKAKGMAKMLFDATVAVDILAGLPGVDAKRLGAIGHSLGGKEVLYLAAFDERIQAAVSSEGGIGIRFSNWNDPWYLGEEVSRDTFGHEHHELLALVAPRALLLLGGDSADGSRSWPFVEAALPVYGLYGRPSRVGLFNHRQGHSVPPEAESRIYDWFSAYL